MTAVGYLELEAPDVDASIDFYEKVLGFEMQSRSENPKGSRSRQCSGWRADKL